MKLVTVAEMQAVEREADSRGLTYAIMMDNAGRGLAEAVEQNFDYLLSGGVLGLVGSGNNGGDTLVALAQLAGQGWNCAAYIVKPRQKDDPLVSALEQAGGEIVSAEDDTKMDRLGAMIAGCSVLLDGVLGTGIKLPLKGRIATILDRARLVIDTSQDPPVVVAVDLPSGVDSDTGEAAPETIPADLTVTMAAFKAGLLQPPASHLIGEVRVAGIGLTDEIAWLALKREVVDADMVRAVLPERPESAHKGTFGTLLVIAGSINYTGAVVLAGTAAYRSGAGLVTLAVPSPLHAPLAGQFPEATWLLLPHEMGVISVKAAEVVLKNLDRATALLVGPGFGLEDTTREFLAQLLGSGAAARRAGIGFISAPASQGNAQPAQLPPLLVDADGLKLLARIPEWPSRLPAPAVLTPHPGEMSVLTGLETAEIQAARMATAERFAAQWGHVVVLKGANTVVASPDGRTAVIPVMTPALARAGTGDVLAGLIAGLRAQGVEAYEAALAGAWIHAQAGLSAAESLGNTASVLAGDVLDSVPEVISDLLLGE